MVDRILRCEDMNENDVTQMDSRRRFKRSTDKDVEEADDMDDRIWKVTPGVMDLKH